MKCLRELKEYFEKHFEKHFAVSFIAFFIFIFMIVFQGYLKHEYLQYLIEKTYSMEEAVMESVKCNVNHSMHELIFSGVKMATDKRLLSLAIN